MREQLKYLIYDLDRWAYAKRFPKALIPLIALLYPACWPVVSYRLGRSIRLLEPSWISRFLYIFFFPVRRLVEILTCTEISDQADIGPGFYIAHLGSIVVGKGTSAGANFSIRQNVTLGGSGDSASWAHPTLGDNVVLAAGAAVIGGVHIGDNVIIGANAVAVKNIPSGARAAGVPAKVLNLKGAYGINIRPNWTYLSNDGTGGE